MKILWGWFILSNFPSWAHRLSIPPSTSGSSVGSLCCCCCVSHFSRSDMMKFKHKVMSSSMLLPHSHEATSTGQTREYISTPSATYCTATSWDGGAFKMGRPSSDLSDQWSRYSSNSPWATKCTEHIKLCSPNTEVQGLITLFSQLSLGQSWLIQTVMLKNSQLQ